MPAPGETGGALGGPVAPPRPSAWLPAAAEAEAYEGIREGDETAFRTVAQPLQPVLRRLVGLTVSSPAVDEVIVRTWTGALRGLDMFRWHTPFATWVAQGAVAHAHAAVGAPPPPSRPAEPPPPEAHPEPVPGPADWSDLPWSARWDDALPTLAAALAALPPAQREVVVTQDMERWPTRRVCDVLGLPEVVHARQLAEGRRPLRNALARLVGEPDTRAHLAAQMARTADAVRLLGWPPDDGRDELDPEVVRVFRRWRAGRLPIRRRLHAVARYSGAASP